MIIKCSSGSISFGENEEPVTKNTIGLVVVFFDLLIVFSFWCSMLSLKKLQDTTENEINSGSVNPSDFTVVMS